MTATPDDLFARLEQLGITTRTHWHEAVFTVAQSQALCGEIAGGHSKNLFLKDKKDRLYLLVAHEDTAIDLKSLNKAIGSARLSFGRPELLQEVLGVPPGSVTPFALMNDTRHRVHVLLDEALLSHETLNFHPLTNTATTSIAKGDLLRFIAACGHQIATVALAADGQESPKNAIPL